MKNKRIIRYSNTKEIYNGNVTIIEGNAQIFVNEGSELDRCVSKTIDDLFNLRSDFNIDTCVQAKGIAKLYAGDNYDQKTGKIIASNKAEIKATTKVLKNVENLIEELDTLKAKLVKEADATKTRIEELKSNLKEY